MGNPEPEGLYWKFIYSLEPVENQKEIFVNDDKTPDILPSIINKGDKKSNISSIEFKINFKEKGKNMKAKKYTKFFEENKKLVEKKIFPKEGDILEINGEYFIFQEISEDNDLVFYTFDPYDFEDIDFDENKGELIIPADESDWSNGIGSVELNKIKIIPAGSIRVAIFSKRRNIKTRKRPLFTIESEEEIDTTDLDWID
jgi:hypothetical protein